MALAGGDDGEGVDWTSPVSKEKELEERMGPTGWQRTRDGVGARRHKMCSSGQLGAPRETGRATGRSDRSREKRTKRRRRPR